MISSILIFSKYIINIFDLLFLIFIFSNILSFMFWFHIVLENENFMKYEDQRIFWESNFPIEFCCIIFLLICYFYVLYNYKKWVIFFMTVHYVSCIIPCWSRDLYRSCELCKMNSTKQNYQLMSRKFTKLQFVIIFPPSVKMC